MWLTSSADASPIMSRDCIPILATTNAIERCETAQAKQMRWLADFSISSPGINKNRTRYTSSHHAPIDGPPNGLIASS